MEMLELQYMFQFSQPGACEERYMDMTITKRSLNQTDYDSLVTEAKWYAEGRKDAEGIDIEPMLFALAYQAAFKLFEKNRSGRAKWKGLPAFFNDYVAHAVHAA